MNGVSEKKISLSRVFVDLAAAIGIFILYAALKIPCPIRFLTGISCAGCGMTRAYLALLHGDIYRAAVYHPLFPIVPVFLVFFLLRNKIPRVYKAVCVITVVLFIGVYIWRMMDSSCDIVVFAPKDGFFARLLLR